MLSLAAAGLYVIVAACCVLAAVTAAGQRQIPWHLRSWLVVGLLFVVLAAARVLALEEVLRVDLRQALYAEGTYEQRRSVQQPLVAAIIVLAAAGAGWWVNRFWRKARGRRNIAAMLALTCSAAMIFLVVLRLISLHAVDALLYGPVKLNWIVDIGSSLTVIGAALVYWRVVRGRA